MSGLRPKVDALDRLCRPRVKWAELVLKD